MTTDSANVRRTDIQHMPHVATILSPLDIIACLTLLTTTGGTYSIRPLYRQGYRGPERLSNLLKTAQRVCGRAGLVWTQPKVGGGYLSAGLCPGSRVLLCFSRMGKVALLTSAHVFHSVKLIPGSRTVMKLLGKLVLESTRHSLPLRPLPATVYACGDTTV